MEGIGQLTCQLAALVITRVEFKTLSAPEHRQAHRPISLSKGKDASVIRDATGPELHHLDLVGVSGFAVHAHAANGLYGQVCRQSKAVADVVIDELLHLKSVANALGNGFVYPVACISKRLQRMIDLLGLLVRSMKLADVG